jgi:hypothetical protein
MLSDARRLFSLLRARVIPASEVERVVARYLMRLLYLRLKFALVKYPGPQTR